KTWRKSDPKFRADILFRAAAIVRRRKSEFTAHLVKEGGKPWKEADADVAEGIDFLEYYGRQMLELKDGVPINSRPIEYNQFHYIRLWSCYFTVELPVCDYGRYNGSGNGNG